MNIYTYLEKTAKKIPLRERMINYIFKNIAEPAGMFTTGTVAGSAAATLSPIATTKALYSPKALKQAAKDLARKDSIFYDAAANRALLLGHYAGDIGARSAAGYGAYKGGQKIKKYLQDNKRGK